MKKIILGSLFLILLISGCIEGIPGLQNCDIPFICQSNQVNVTKLGPDILVIKDINVIPKGSIRPNDEFSVYFQVKNQEENEIVRGVNYSLFDTGLCSFKGGTPNATTSTSKQWDDGNFAPAETKQGDWSFSAPSLENIANLRTVCPIKFKITYNYTSRSQVDIGLIDDVRLKELQRSGKDVSYSPNLNIGRGPVKIYFDFGGTLPARNNSNLSFYVRVVDEGSGLYTTIPKGKLSIQAPDMNSAFKNMICVNDYFECGHDDANKRRHCENTLKVIPLITKKTFDIKCTLETPSIVNEEETRYINAYLPYDYDVIGSASVEVKP